MKRGAVIEQLEPLVLSRRLWLFLQAAREDVRINAIHISLYTAIVFYCQEEEYQHPVSVFSHDIMPLSKISGTATYHRSIRELHQYGYIKYVPSYNHFLGSLIYIMDKEM